MKRGFRFALILPVAVLIGCSLPSTPSPSDPTPTGDWSNWQIQAGTAITSPPNTYPSFVGAVQIQGTQTSGIFTTVEASGTPTAEDYSGTFSSSTENVSLGTYGFDFAYTQPAAPYSLVPVGVIGGCVYPPGYTGPECLAIFESPSVGVEIAPLTGTYTGTLTSVTPGISGTATLILTQSSTPNASGAFPLTGSIVFPSNGNLGTDPLTGTVSGEGVALSFVSAAVIGPDITFTGSTTPSAAQITVSNLTWAQTGLSYAFTGTLTRQ